MWSCSATCTHWTAWSLLSYEVSWVRVLCSVSGSGVVLCIWCSCRITPRTKGGEKGQRRGSRPCTVCIVLLQLLFLYPLLRFHSPHDWITQSPRKYTCAYLHTHTHAFLYPPPSLPAWFIVTPSFPQGVVTQGERRERARRKGQNIIECSEKWGEHRAESSGVMMSSLAFSALRRQQAALCNTTSAEHELHDAQCWS